MESDEKLSISYETLWKFIIRPPRDEYDETLLCEKEFVYRNKTYLRKDYDLLSSEGYLLKCSLIEPNDDSRPTDEMPIVIYLHGNSSSRLEGLRMASLLLKHDINIFVFDFAGCGLSEGDYISLGFHEKEDVRVVIDFLERLPGVGKIGLWGRSMGAATCLLYGATDPRVCCMCVDSPFADFYQLAKELCLKQVKWPDFILSTALAFIRKTVKGKNGLDINELKPIECVKNITIPGLFIHAMKDEWIPIEHCLKIFELYGGEKALLSCNGGHNSVRPKNVIKRVGDFFASNLKGENGEKEDDQVKSEIKEEEMEVNNEEIEKENQQYADELIKELNKPKGFQDL